MIDIIDLTYTMIMGVKVLGSSPLVVGSEPGNLFPCYRLTLGVMFGGELCLGICSLCGEHLLSYEYVLLVVI